MSEKPLIAILISPDGPEEIWVLGRETLNGQPAPEDSSLGREWAVRLGWLQLASPAMRVHFKRAATCSDTPFSPQKPIRHHPQGTAMEYLESDLHAASYLLALGFRLVGLELVGTRYSFKFESDSNSGDANAAICEYRQGAMIPARDFAAAIQQLKGELYAAKYKKDGNGNDRHSSIGR